VVRQGTPAAVAQVTTDAWLAHSLTLTYQFRCPRQQLTGGDVKKVLVVTDSSATVPTDLVQQLDIRIVPILLQVDGQTFRDGVDITAKQVYQWQRSGQRLPTTSSPSVGDFLRVYAQAAEEASGIVSVHLPPSISAIYNVALTASQLQTDVPIRLVNSPTRIQRPWARALSCWKLPAQPPMAPISRRWWRGRRASPRGSTSWP